jgi:2-dehydro-3-deoxyphosphogluconate aldolase/(4S)-4-hydroxy-2-oxoglutarate aldolase
MTFIENLQKTAVVAVIRGSSADEAVAMSEALLRGGIRGLELTYTTPNCAEALDRVRDIAPDDALIGVGSVRQVEQIEEAVAKGAQFAVSPHFEPELIIAALETRLPYLPGGITPTEIVQAWESGAAAVKIFPASIVGPSYLKAVYAPLPDVPLMPTGGVDIDNMTDWLDAGACAVGMGGQLVRGSVDDIEATAARVSARLAEWRAGSAS